MHSRSTLRAEHHEGLRGRVYDLIRSLKTKTGKALCRFSREDEASENGIPCVEALARTIAAPNYRVMKLAKEPSSVELGQATLSGATRARRQRHPSSLR